MKSRAVGKTQKRGSGGDVKRRLEDDPGEKFQRKVDDDDGFKAFRNLHNIRPGGRREK